MNLILQQLEVLITAIVVFWFKMKMSASNSEETMK